MFELDKIIKQRCEGCRYRRKVYANGGYNFNGCCHNPYKGKWVAEIKDCPMENSENKKEGK